MKQSINFDSLLKSKSQNIKIGELNQSVIDALNLDLKPQNIYMWNNRILDHCEKHKNDYSSTDSYNEAIRNIPTIINNPDYVGIHERNGNITFIKKLTDISLVGIKITHSKDNSLLFRTIYPITESKLNKGIDDHKYLKI